MSRHPDRPLRSPEFNARRAKISKLGPKTKVAWDSKAKGTYRIKDDGPLPGARDKSKFKERRRRDQSHR